jgi:hypothetical protein
LTKEETAKMTAGWQHNMEAVQTAIVAHNGFDWQNFKTMRTPSKGAKCAAFLRSACTKDSSFQTDAVRVSFCVHSQPILEFRKVSN